MPSHGGTGTSNGVREVSQACCPRRRNGRDVFWKKNLPSTPSGYRLIVTARHSPLSGPFPYGEASAIAEVQEVAKGRADLLAAFAGMCLGLSVTQPVDQLAGQLVAQASLVARAAAEMDQVARWIAAGIARGEQVSASHRPR
jgi:hypothetical protein